LATISPIDVGAVQGLYRYNRWANDRVFDTVSQLTTEQFTKDLGSSYPSVRDTLVHIVWAEWVWLQRWKGAPPRVVFEGADFPHLGALKTRWSEVEGEQEAILAALTAEQLLSVVSYENLQGQDVEIPAVAADVARREPLDLSPRAAGEDATSARGTIRSDGPPGVRQRTAIGDLMSRGRRQRAGYFARPL
jgi:hypothetical protein